MPHRPSFAFPSEARKWVGRVLVDPQGESQVDPLGESPRSSPRRGRWNKAQGERVGRVLVDPQGESPRASPRRGRWNKAQGERSEPWVSRPTRHEPPNGGDGNHPARRAACCFAFLLLAVLTLAGCGKSHTRFKHPRFMNESDCAGCLQVALDAQSPDVRREAIIQLSKTSYLTRDVMIRALGSIARTDQSDSVRYAAVRALAKAAVPGVVEPLLAIMSAPEESGEATDVRAGAVRWAALEGLDPLVARGELSAEQREVCRAAAIQWLGKHRSRDVRVSAARLLRHFQTGAVLDALIDALEQRDFGVVYESDRSLMHLTGQRLDYDAATWRRWRASTDDPFAGAGQLDKVLYPEEENWWERTVSSTRETLGGFRPK
jgi:hypothetical protein